MWGDTRDASGHVGHRHDFFTRVLGLGTLAILGYCLVSALNARSTYYPAAMQYQYYDCIQWLPHSYDSARSWRYFWTYLALALVFWSVRDWLLLKTERDVADQKLPDLEVATGKGFHLPARLRLLLWVITINGAVLAAEGLIQRTIGTTRLLWIIEPSINKTPETQFGPYAYRSNAAQWFLLAWPLVLGFWWLARGRARYHVTRFSLHNDILVGAFVMALIPFLSLSRGAMAIGAVSIVLAAVVVIGARSGADRRMVLGVVLLLLIAIPLGIYVDWDHMKARLITEGTFDANRWEAWQNTWKVFNDYPVYGTGPGTFSTVYQLYRSSLTEVWYAQAHNDYLETLMTFGVGGTCLIVVTFVSALGRRFTGSGLRVHRLFPRMFYLALGSCLAFAAADFPLQIHSVLFLFLIECAILSVLSERR